MSSFLLSKYGHCNAAGCANTNEHRPMNTRNSVSAPEAVLSEVDLYHIQAINQKAVLRKRIKYARRNLGVAECWQ